MPAGLRPGRFVARGLAVFDDGLGSGSALYVSGGFTAVGGYASKHVARWACPEILGDLDGDGDVDLSDLAILQASYGVDDGGDIDGDGDTDLSDLAILLSHYGEGA